MREKPLEWIGSSYKDLMAMPESIRDVFGHALGQAQMGRRYSGTKILKGFGDAGVLEVIENGEGGTYRDEKWDEKTCC